MCQNELLHTAGELPMVEVGRGRTLSTRSLWQATSAANKRQSPIEADDTRVRNSVVSPRLPSYELAAPCISAGEDPLCTCELQHDIEIAESGCPDKTTALPVSQDADRSLTPSPRLGPSESTKALAWISYSLWYSPSFCISSLCVPDSTSSPSFMHLPIAIRNRPRTFVKRRLSQDQVGMLREVPEPMRDENHRLPGSQ